MSTHKPTERGMAKSILKGCTHEVSVARQSPEISGNTHQSSGKCLPLTIIFLTTVMLTACGATPRVTTNHSQQFKFVEATIADMHIAMQTGELSCRTVVQGYIDRLNAFDLSGPSLHTVITLNPAALDEADELDRKFKLSGLQGPLHCVTVMAKDNFDTDDMPTTAGAKAFQNNRPTRDAFVITKLRAAGAIILAKANMDEFAFTYKGSSSIAGQVRNAYDINITPGGSSSGTGTAVAASMAMVGLGTDTGGSVRVPSAVQGLSGLRPSLRLLSQNGIVPLAHSEDTAGPMCRTVQDCALMMNTLVGYDPEPDSGQRRTIEHDAPQIGSVREYAEITKAPTDYMAYLDTNGLRGAHIGVVRQFFPLAASADKILFNDGLDAALERMKAAGAIVEDVTIPDLDRILVEFKTVKPYEFKGDLERYLNRWSSERDHHVRNYHAMLSTGLYESRNIEPIAEYAKSGDDLIRNADYMKNITERFPFVRARLMQTLDNTDSNGKQYGQRFDVLIYPTRAGLNTSQDGKSSNSPATSRLSSFSGFPAMTIPVGMVTPPLMASSKATKAQPIGLEMLAREFDEGSLIKIAYAWQQTAKPRRPPTLTPELSIISTK